MNFKEYVKSKFNSLADWVIKHAPPRPKIVDNVYNFVSGYKVRKALNRQPFLRKSVNWHRVLRKFSKFEKVTRQ